MDTHTIHDTGELFADSEVIKLCDTIKNTHRILGTLGLFLVDLETTKTSKTASVKTDFQRWGIRAVSEKFIVHQNRSLKRLIEIYTAETERLISRTR